MIYNFTCNCGEKWNVKASNRDEAEHKFQEKWNDPEIRAHFSSIRHIGDPAPDKQHMDALISSALDESS